MTNSIHLANAKGRDATVGLLHIKSPEGPKMGLPNERMIFQRYLAVTESTAHDAASKENLKNLEINGAQITDLAPLAKLAQLEKLTISSCPNLVDASALGSLERLNVVSIQNCKKLEILPNEWKSTVKTLSLTRCPSLKHINALPPGIDAKAIAIDDRRLLPRAKAAKALKADIGSVWKLLSSRNVADILMGIELSSGVEEGLEILFEGVTVKDGQLIRGKRFSGTGPAQPYLDFALFGLMSRAKSGTPLAKLREKIEVLNLTFTSLSPHLTGLTSLESLAITPLDETTPDLSNFGSMPSLTTLRVTGRRWNSVGGISSLNGLDAPNLKIVELSSIYLRDLLALNNSPQITTLDLQGNGSLENLDGIKACAPNLLELNLRECKSLANIDILSNCVAIKKLDLYGCENIATIKPLASCKSLSTINLENCKNLISLEGLESLLLECQPDYSNDICFSLDGCSSLNSLAYFPPIGEVITSLSLQYTQNLKDFHGLRTLNKVSTLSAPNSGLSNLQDIDSMPNLESVHFNECHSLHNVEPLGSLLQLQTVNLNNSAAEEMPTSWSSQVISISLKNCKLIKSFGQLPTSLKNLVCDGADSIAELNGIENCQALEEISALNCKALIKLGRLPRNVKKLIANSCSQLKSLDGLESCGSLEFIGIPLSVTDAGALSNLSHITVNINVTEIMPEKKESKELITLPKMLIKTLNTLQSMSLQAKGPSSSWYSQSTFDFASFNQFKNLRTLSFAEFDISSKIEGLSWLIPIEKLEGLWFSSRGNLSYTLGSSIYDSSKKVRALQLKICQEAKIVPPTHLLIE